MTAAAIAAGSRPASSAWRRTSASPSARALGRDPDRHPAVPETAGPPPRGLRASAHPERRAARLHRLRLDGDALEAVEAARERRVRSGEQRSQHAHAFVRPRAALAGVGADCLEVLAALAADAHAEHDAAAGQVVERRELPGDERRVPERQQHDGRADRDPLRAGREARERHGDVEDRVVERDVVAGPERVVSGFLGHLGHGPEVAGVRELADHLARPLQAELHACSAMRTAYRQVRS